MLLLKRASILMETLIRAVPRATKRLNLATAVAHSIYASIMDTASLQVLVIGATGWLGSLVLIRSGKARLAHNTAMMVSYSLMPKSCVIPG